MDPVKLVDQLYMAIRRFRDERRKEYFDEAVSCTNQLKQLGWRVKLDPKELVVHVFRPAQQEVEG